MTHQTSGQIINKIEACEVRIISDASGLSPTYIRMMVRGDRQMRSDIHRSIIELRNFRNELANTFKS